MPTAERRRKEIQRDLYELARKGASIHQLMARFPGARWEDAERALAQVAEDNKASGPAHRANLRAVIREHATVALSIISKLAQDEQQNPAIRLRAAESLLRHSCDFMDETVMRSWQERHDTSADVQPTLFDFGPVIEENGAIAFRGETRLMLVENDDDDA